MSAHRVMKSLIVSSCLKGACLGAQAKESHRECHVDLHLVPPYQCGILLFSVQFFTLFSVNPGVIDS